MLLLPLVAGCGQAHFEADAPPPRSDRVEKMLKGMADSGDRSPLPYLKQEVMQLKTEGDSRADALLADIAKLERTAQPAEFKARERRSCTTASPRPSERRGTLKRELQQSAPT